MKIYVASSWRNEYQPLVVDMLKVYGIEVYDFKDSEGFSWREVNPTWEVDDHGLTIFLEMLAHPRSQQGFDRDFEAMKTSNKCILVLPCGRSAHLEAGWFIGREKPVAIFIPDYDGPDLMYKMADFITGDFQNLVEWACTGAS